MFGEFSVNENFDGKIYVGEFTTDAQNNFETCELKKFGKKVNINDKDIAKLIPFESKKTFLGNFFLSQFLSFFSFLFSSALTR